MVLNYKYKFFKGNKLRENYEFKEIMVMRSLGSGSIDFMNYRCLRGRWCQKCVI